MFYMIYTMIEEFLEDLEAQFSAHTRHISNSIKLQKLKNFFLIFSLQEYYNVLY